jgi:hypothetical protein
VLRSFVALDPSRLVFKYTCNETPEPCSPHPRHRARQPTLGAAYEAKVGAPDEVAARPRADGDGADDDDWL